MWVLEKPHLHCSRIWTLFHAMVTHEKLIRKGMWCPGLFLFFVCFLRKVTPEVPECPKVSIFNNFISTKQLSHLISHTAGHTPCPLKTQSTGETDMK